MADQPTTPKKIVRFNIDGEEVPSSPTAETAPTIPSTSKTVRFAAEKTELPAPIVLDAAPESAPTLAITTTPVGLNDTTSSLAHPAHHSNVSQSSSTTSSNNPDTSTLTPTDIASWRDTVTTIPASQLYVSKYDEAEDEQNATLARPDSTTAGGDWTIAEHEISQEKAYSPTDVGVEQDGSGALFEDEGEKDKDGKVIEASQEPCEKCGGKVVWATRGEWLLVCGGCGEPQ
jgi:ribosomal protein S27AE